MNGCNITMHFLDLHQQQFENYKNHHDCYTPDEYIELIMHQIVQTLLQITIFCYQVTIPQKWVGSSIAIGYDVATLPHISKSEDEIRSSIKINIFDFGRSELTTYINPNTIST